MGFSVEMGTAESAPSWHFNHGGAETWFGKSLEQMTPQEVIRMLAFCFGEGQRRVITTKCNG